MRYFFDASAIIGVLFGEPRFSRFSGSPFRTSPIHVLEVGLFATRKSLPFRALDLRDVAEPIETEDIEEAVRFKVSKDRKRKADDLMPIPDALGYAMARRRDLLFVTSDRKHFEEEAGLELVCEENRRR